MRVTFLGTGASMGVPVIGCSCKVCTSTSLKNKRLRPSLLIEREGKNLLVDIGPDFRQQALQVGLRRLDGILLTHAHFDHIAGMDDLRIFFFTQKEQISILGSKETIEELQRRYNYLFENHQELVVEPLAQDSGEINFLGIPITYMSYFQNGAKVTGYRFGNLAYISDIRKYEEDIFPKLAGLDTLIVSALRHTPTPAHFSLQEAISFSDKVGAKKTYFTHIAHELDCDYVLPQNKFLAYDGMRI